MPRKDEHVISEGDCSTNHTTITRPLYDDTCKMGNNHGDQDCHRDSQDPLDLEQRRLSSRLSSRRSQDRKRKRMQLLYDESDELVEANSRLKDANARLRVAIQTLKGTHSGGGAINDDVVHGASSAADVLGRTPEVSRMPSAGSQITTESKQADSSRVAIQRAAAMNRYEAPHVAVLPGATSLMQGAPQGEFRGGSRDTSAWGRNLTGGGSRNVSGWGRDPAHIPHLLLQAQSDPFTARAVEELLVGHGLTRTSSSLAAFNQQQEGVGDIGSPHLVDPLLATLLGVSANASLSQLGGILGQTSTGLLQPTGATRGSRFQTDPVNDLVRRLLLDGGINFLDPHPQRSSVSGRSQGR